MKRDYVLRDLRMLEDVIMQLSPDAEILSAAVECVPYGPRVHISAYRANIDAALGRLAECRREEDGSWTPDYTCCYVMADGVKVFWLKEIAAPEMSSDAAGEEECDPQNTFDHSIAECDGESKGDDDETSV